MVHQTYQSKRQIHENVMAVGFFLLLKLLHTATKRLGSSAHSKYTTISPKAPGLLGFWNPAPNSETCWLAENLDNSSRWNHPWVWGSWRFFSDLSERRWPATSCKPKKHGSAHRPRKTTFLLHTILCRCWSQAREKWA